MKNLAHLNKYFWKYKKLLGLGILFIIITNLFGVYSPKVVQIAIDLVRESAALKPGQSPALLESLHETWHVDIRSWFDFSAPDGKNTAIIRMSALLAFVYLLTFLLKGVFLFFTRQTIIVMSRYIEYDLKNEIFEQYQRLDTAFYKQNNTGDLMNRISEDVSKVRMYLGPGIMYSINLFFLFIFTVWFMWAENHILTLYVLAPLPVMSVLIYYVSTMINRRSEQVQRQQSRLSTLAQEAFSGIRVIKAYNRSESFRNNFVRESNTYREKQLRLVKVDALFNPVMTILIGLSTIIAIYAGGIRSIEGGHIPGTEGQFTVGNIAEFIMYVNMLTWPFAAVGWVTSINQQAAASMQRINEFLHIVPVIRNTKTAEEKIEGRIEFRDVTFRYSDSGTVALKNVSFTIEPGQTLAIVGRTGSGKSTVAALLTRLYDPASGQVLVDGVDLREHNLSQLRTETGYVPQEVFLFSESVKSNISFGIKGEVSMDEIREAASDAAIHDNIADFREGYETLIGERGITLSGGQKQRISIARAIIKKPRILVFDDCLSAVDTETEEKILGNLRRIMKGRTTVLISHRISTVRQADQIIVLDEGKITEQGNHQQLMELRGRYFELYQKQLLEERNLSGSESA